MGRFAAFTPEEKAHLVEALLFTVEWDVCLAPPDEKRLSRSMVKELRADGAPLIGEEEENGIFIEDGWEV